MWGAITNVQYKKREARLLRAYPSPDRRLLAWRLYEPGNEAQGDKRGPAFFIHISAAAFSAAAIQGDCGGDRGEDRGSAGSQVGA
ncbi:hypothetical protein D3C81_1513420 [compost metagenome]